MKCLETERLFRYAYHLLNESEASQVSAHLESCPRCREIVAQHIRLDVLLDDWKAPGPRPGFDVRVRRATEVQPGNVGAWRLWGLEWTRGLALACLATLMVVGVAWYRHSYRRPFGAPAITGRPSHSARAGARSSPGMKIKPSPSGNDSEIEQTEGVPAAPGAVASWNEDKDAQALEDYDLAANFDLLSELPERASQNAN